MSLRVGIVGLPNVGKSTLFNALTKQASCAKAAEDKGGAEMANYPFTTIEPNIGIVPVPDERLEKLATLSKSAKMTPTTIAFVDIAGLVKDAHKGEGLGNKFLSYIREVDAIAHVVRFFDDPNTIHVANRVDPAADVETVETELALADLATVESARQRAEHDPTSLKLRGAGAKDPKDTLQRLHEHLSVGKQARDFKTTKEENKIIAPLSLLTRKPVLYIANVSEEQISNPPPSPPVRGERVVVLPLCVKIEQELVELTEEERATFLAEYGLTHTGLERLIQLSYQTLGLITFLTTGPTESRAWTVRRGSFAPRAAGKVHTDMERGFIRAETVAYTDLIAAGSYAAARAAGKVRDEGKEYVVKDGDVMLFKFSV